MMSDVSLFATPPEQWKPIGDGAIKSRVWDISLGVYGLLGMG